MVDSAEPVSIATSEDWQANPSPVADSTMAEVNRLRRMCQLLDSAFAVPGTGFRVGLDTLVGLIPGIGDVTTAGFSLYMIHRARQLGVRKRTVVRMLGNVAIDTVIGTVPLVGDLFDAAWKANSKNLKLLEAELQLPSES